MVHPSGKLYPGIYHLYTTRREAIPGYIHHGTHPQGGYTRVLFLVIPSQGGYTRVLFPVILSQDWHNEARSIPFSLRTGTTRRVLSPFSH